MTLECNKCGKVVGYKIAITPDGKFLLCTGKDGCFDKYHKKDNPLISDSLIDDKIGELDE